MHPNSSLLKLQRVSIYGGFRFDRFALNRVTVSGEASGHAGHAEHENLPVYSTFPQNLLWVEKELCF